MHFLLVQVNLFQKHLFLHQLTMQQYKEVLLQLSLNNMTKDCSLNYKFRNVLRRLYSTMLLHFSPLKFPKSVTKLQIPFMFTSFCLSKFNHNKCSKLFLDKLILNLNCFKRANIDIFCLNLLFITMYISIINNK